MAIIDYYETSIAYNAATNELVANAEFTAYLPEDTTFEDPLTIYEWPSGSTAAVIESNSVGVLPEFRVDGDPPQVVLKSGAFTTKLTSVYGAVIAAGLDSDTVAAAIAAAGAAADSADLASAAKTDAESARDDAEAAVEGIGAQVLAAQAAREGAEAAVLQAAEVIDSIETTATQKVAEAASSVEAQIIGHVDDAQAARDAAVIAKDGSESAQELAEAARDAAQSAVAGAESLAATVAAETRTEILATVVGELDTEDGAIAALVESSDSLTRTALNSAMVEAMSDDESELAVVTDIRIGSKVQRYAPHPRVRKPRTSALFTVAQQSAASIYLPNLFDRRPMGGTDIGIIYSTDHDAGEGGVYLLTTPDLLNPTWTDHGRIFVDTTVGSQTETPSAPWFDEASGYWVFTYQQLDNPAGFQSTLIAKTETPLVNNSWTRHGLIMQKQLGPGGYIEPGTGHSGYANEPFLFGGTRYVRSLYGGFEWSQNALWRQGESALDPWEVVRRFKSHVQLSRGQGEADIPTTSASGESGGVAKYVRSGGFGRGPIVMFNGTPWWIGSIGTPASGLHSETRRIVAAPMDTDLTTMLAKPIDITPEPQDWEHEDGIDWVGGFEQIDGVTFALYRTGGATGSIGLLEVF